MAKEKSKSFPIKVSIRAKDKIIMKEKRNDRTNTYSKQLETAIKNFYDKYISSEGNTEFPAINGDRDSKVSSRFSHETHKMINELLSKFHFSNREALVALAVQEYNT